MAAGSGVAFDGAAHAAGAAPAAAEFAARDGDHLDAVVLQVGVGGHVPLVGHDHSRFDGQHVAAVVPLLALRGVDVLDRRQDGDGGPVERGGHGPVHVLGRVVGDLELGGGGA